MIDRATGARGGPTGRDHDRRTAAGDSAGTVEGAVDADDPGDETLCSEVAGGTDLPSVEESDLGLDSTTT